MVNLSLQDLTNLPVNLVGLEPHVIRDCHFFWPSIIVAFEICEAACPSSKEDMFHNALNMRFLSAGHIIMHTSMMLPLVDRTLLKKVPCHLGVGVAL